MDGLTFFSNLIHDIAWPGATLVALAIVLRRTPHIAQFIKTFRYKDMEVTFRDEFLEAKVVVDQMKVSLGSINQLETNEDHQILKLAEIDPASAVFKVWQRLEAKIIQLIQHNGLVRHTNPRSFIQRLLELRLITEDEAILFNRLREIRDYIVHLVPFWNTRTLTIAEVIEFKDFKTGPLRCS